MRSIRLRLTSPEGIERGSRRIRSNKAGSFKGCFDAGVDVGNILGAHTQSLSRRWQVPDITVHVDRANDTVTGRAPAGAALHVELRRGGNGFLPKGSGSADGLADLHGRYTMDLAPALDIGAGMVGYLTARIGADEVDTVGNALWVVTQQGQPNVYGFAGGPLHFELRGSGGLVRATADAPGNNQDHLYMVLLLDRQGQLVYPRPGDHLLVSGTDHANLLIPDGSLNGRVGTHTVYGRCMPGVDFDLWGPGEFVGSTDALGRFQKTMPSGHPIRRGELLSLFCHYPSGDIYQINTSVH